LTKKQIQEKEDAMQRFIQRFSDKIIGVLSGFDRLILRGSLRQISYARNGKGLQGLLCKQHVLLKDFGHYVESVSEQLKEASCQAAIAQQRPIHYLRSSKTDKHALAQKIAEKDGIRNGLVAVFTCVEPCMSFRVGPNPQTKKLEIEYLLRKCLFIYHYLIDPQFGFMNARIQSWFPFQIQICLNGREWLAHQMDHAGIRYRRLENCFPWIENFEKAQKLMDRQLRTAWPRALDRFAHMLNPIHRKIFKDFPIRYYWSASESEWATDLAFKNPSALASVYPTLVLHAMTTFSSGDVMRFLGRRIRSDFEGEIVSDFKNRPEGVRIKHRVGKNSLKLYDKQASILRAEFTMNYSRDFRVFRRKENDPRGQPKWHRLRLGVADLHRRAQVSQAANDRYLDALSTVDTSTRLGDLLDSISKPTTWNGKRVRALRPWAKEDLDLFRSVSRGEFSINGFRNRDLQALLFKGQPTTLQEKQRRCGRVSRLLRLLRAHHMIKKVPSTYRYVLTAKGCRVIAAVLTAQRITLDQINKLAA
jgi:hypothetical protein